MPYRVVLVEDDPDVRELITMLLEIDGRFELVGSAEEGAAGIALVGQEQPDAVVLDLQLPGMDGLTAIPGLRQAAPHLRIVVFSSFPDPYTLLDVLGRGADSYLDKAMAWAELVPTLARLCRASAAALGEV